MHASLLRTQAKLIMVNLNISQNGIEGFFDSNLPSSTFSAEYL